MLTSMSFIPCCTGDQSVASGLPDATREWSYKVLYVSGGILAPLPMMKLIRGDYNKVFQTRPRVLLSRRLSNWTKARYILYTTALIWWRSARMLGPFWPRREDSSCIKIQPWTATRHSDTLPSTPTLVDQVHIEMLSDATNHVPHRDVMRGKAHIPAQSPTSPSL